MSLIIGEEITEKNNFNDFNEISLVDDTDLKNNVNKLTGIYNKL